MPSPAPDVVSALQRSASLHLTAVEHYATLGEHLARWGYAKLGERWRTDAEEERGHFKAVAARLEFYDRGVSLQHDPAFWPRHDVPGQLSASLALETAAAAAERANIVTSRANGDEQSALMFAKLLEGSEDSIRQLEADLEVIREVGIDNWLANLI